MVSIGASAHVGFPPKIDLSRLPEHPVLQRRRGDRHEGQGVRGHRLRPQVRRRAQDRHHRVPGELVNYFLTSRE